MTARNAVNFPFRVRLRADLPVYGGRTGLAVRQTQQGKLVVHLDAGGVGDVWEGARPTAWVQQGGVGRDRRE